MNSATSNAPRARLFRVIAISSPTDGFFPCRAILALLAASVDARRPFDEGPMLHNPGVTERLARFVVETQFGDLPKDVAHQAKRSVMNLFAVALTGCRTETVETLLQTLAAFS